MTLLIAYLIQSTILFAVAAALERWFLRDLGLRETVWKAAMVVSLAAPLAGWGLPWAASGHREAAVSVERRQFLLQDGPLGAPRPMRLHAEVDMECWQAAAHGRPSPEDVRRTMADCGVQRAGIAPWAKMGGGLLALFSIGLVLGHLRSTTRLLGLLRRGRHMGHVDTRRGRARLLALDGIVSPFAAGSRTVVLPSRTFRELTDGQLQAVLAHEVGHLARRDPHWLWTARLMERALFFQPLNRLCRRRLEEIGELASDDLARRSVGSGRPLAESIAAVSAWSAGRSPAPALSRRPGLVSRRVARLLGPAPDSEPPMFSLRLGLVVLLVMAALATPSLRSGSKGPVGSVEMVVRVEPPSGGGGDLSR